MQILNKGYIKAAHSARCTIAELGRGMDYSDNERRGKHKGRQRSSAHSVTDREMQAWARMTTQAAANVSSS